MAFKLINQLNGRVYFVNKAGFAGRRGRRGSIPKLWYFTRQPTDNTLPNQSYLPHYLTIKLSKRNTFYVVRKDKPERSLPDLVKLRRQVALAFRELEWREEQKQYVPDGFPWWRLSQLKVPSQQVCA